MRKRNIQIIIDVSMSMKVVIGLVYAFLYQFLSYTQEVGGVMLTFQLTWFSGEEWKCVEFANGKKYTDSFVELMGTVKMLYLKKGAKSNRLVIQQALEASMKQAYGESTEQVLFYFSDYRLKEMLNLDKMCKVNRVFLFVPDGQSVFYRFTIVNVRNTVQKLMPILLWSLESLKEELSENDMECMLNYLA